MAVRDDFAAGEVLAAADLNDTFASKQEDVMTTKGDLAAYGTAVDRLAVGTDGQVLTADSGETLGVKWAAAAGGLTLIDTTSFTTSSAVNVNDVFTSAHTNYRLICIGVGSTNDGVGLRLRASGTDATGNNYTVARITGNGSSASSSTGTGTSFAGVAQMSTNMFILDALIARPNLAATTFLASFGGRENYMELRTGYHTLTTAYDGFSVLPGSGTITGNYYVYGYSE